MHFHWKFQAQEGNFTGLQGMCQTQTLTVAIKALDTTRLVCVQAAGFPTCSVDDSSGYRIGSAAGAAGSVVGEWERVSRPSLAPPSWAPKGADGQFKDVVVSGADQAQRRRVTQLDSATTRILQHGSSGHGIRMRTGHHSGGGGLTQRVSVSQQQS